MTDPRILPVDLASPLADVVAPLLLPTADPALAAASILELIDRELDRRALALTTLGERLHVGTRDPAASASRIARRVADELHRRGAVGRDERLAISALVEDFAGAELRTPAPAPAPSPAIVGAAVRFHDLEAFAGELKADRDLVERGIVRVAFRRRPFFRGVNVPELLSLIAGAIVAGRYVRLELAIGELWGFDTDQGTRDRAQATETELRAAVEALGLELRDGVIEELDR